MATVVGNGTTTKKEKFSPASKFIELVEYDPTAFTADITFRSGSQRRYLLVYPVTFLSWKQSPTFDAFYSRAIKNNFQSVSLEDSGIGRKESTPLKHVKKERNLDSGLRKQQARYERTAGTVARALAAA